MIEELIVAKCLFYSMENFVPYLVDLQDCFAWRIFEEEGAIVIVNLEHYVARGTYYCAFSSNPPGLGGRGQG